MALGATTLAQAGVTGGSGPRGARSGEGMGELGRSGAGSPWRFAKTENGAEAGPSRMALRVDPAAFPHETAAWGQSTVWKTL